MTSFAEASERSDGGKIGTSFRTEQQKFLINMPCKYHKKGLCKLGKSCRFLHNNQKTKKTPVVNLPTTAEKTVCVQISKFGRRPFLQLVVLYASDDRVSKYSDEILEILLSAGIDVVVQNSVQGFVAQTPTSKVPKAKDIKAEHLAELICTSHADFLIVVGDKNMKNKSCQAKRKGKLLEMMVEDVISLIWKSWPQNPHKTLARIKSLTTEQTTSLLFQYCGPKHISDRFEYLCNLKKEILSTYKIGSWCDSLEDKLTNLQKCAITLHKQLKKAMKVLSELTVQVENPEMSRGSVKTFEYKPSACRTPKSTIAYPLQIHLYCFIVNMMKEIETFEIRFPVSMWTEYFTEHLTTWNVDLEELDRIQAEMWRAFEEHEQSLNQLEEEEDEESNPEVEEGMFSNMKDTDLANFLFDELEPEANLLDEVTLQRSGTPDSSRFSDSPIRELSPLKTLPSTTKPTVKPAAAQPLKYAFPFPVINKPIFIPERKASPPPRTNDSSAWRANSSDKSQETKAVGIGRGAVGMGRGMASRDSSRTGSTTRNTETRTDAIGRRSSTSDYTPGHEQRRDWVTRGSTAPNLSREPSSPVMRRASDFGPGRVANFEPSTRRRALSKEEKLLSVQLDRQQERRLELERQLMKERELEMDLQRQLEKRTQRQKQVEMQTNDNTSYVNEPRYAVGQLNRIDSRQSLSQDTQSSYNSSFSCGNSLLPQLQPSPRRISFGSQSPSPRLGSLNLGERPCVPSAEEKEIPVSPRSHSFSLGDFPRHPPGLSPAVSNYGKGSLLRERMSSTPEPLNTPISLPSPRPPTPGLSSPASLSPRDLTLFPTTRYGGPIQRSDPFYQEISKIWGQEKTSPRLNREADVKDAFNNDSSNSNSHSYEGEESSRSPPLFGEGR